MFFKQFLLISIIINISLCERLSNEYLEGWGEKVINEDTQDYSKILEIVENYFTLEEGYSLDETEILPFGFFKQTVNGINYRLLCTVKKKSDQTPTIFDIMTHKHNNEFKVLSSKKPEDSSSELSEKDKKTWKEQLLNIFLKNYIL